MCAKLAGGTWEPKPWDTFDVLRAKTATWLQAYIMITNLTVLGNYSCMCEVPPITCIFHCTKIMANLSLPAGRLQCRLTYLMIGWFWSKNRHYFNSNNLHYLVQRDWLTLKGKVASVCTSALLKWTNTWIIPASEKLNAFITSSLSFPQSGRHLVDSRNRLTHGG